MKKSIVKYAAIVFLLVALLCLALWNNSSNNLTSAATVNPPAGRADWSGGVGPPPPGNAVDTFANLRNQVLSREGHVAPESASSSNPVQGSGSALSASGLFSLALNQITGTITGFGSAASTGRGEGGVPTPGPSGGSAGQGGNPNVPGGTGGAVPADQPPSCSAEKKDKCIGCPPKCPMPKIPEIEQPGDGGGGGGGGGGGAGGGGGGGGNGNECGPGSDSQNEISQISDDTAERYGAMEEQMMHEYTPEEARILERAHAPRGRPGREGITYGSSLPGMAVTDTVSDTVSLGASASVRTQRVLANPILSAGQLGRTAEQVRQMNLAQEQAALLKKQAAEVSPEDISAAGDVFSPQEYGNDGFIELYNPLEKKSISLDGYELRDYTGNVVLPFPPGAEIGPGEYRVIAFSPIFEANFKTESDYVFEGFNVAKFKGTIVLAYNGPEGFKYVDYVRYGEKSKPMFIQGDTPPAKQRFIPVDLEVQNKVIISEFTIDFGNKMTYVELVNVGQNDYSLNGHRVVVYAGEDYYEGSTGITLSPGEPFVLQFGNPVSSGMIGKDWICPAGLDMETELCMSPVIPANAKMSSFTDLDDALHIPTAGLVPRIEAALIKESCDSPPCTPVIIDDFTREITEVPYTGVVSFRVSEQKIFRGSAIDRSGDFVQDSPSLGIFEAIKDVVVQDIISPRGRSRNIVGEEEASAGKSVFAAMAPGKAMPKRQFVPGGVSEAVGPTGRTIAETVQSEIWSAALAKVSVASAPVQAVPSPSIASQAVMAASAITAASVIPAKDLTAEELAEAKAEMLEYPCETVLRQYEVCVAGAVPPLKSKTLIERIAEFDVDAALEAVLEGLRNQNVDIDDPDVYKENLGNIHSRIVENLFEAVWEFNHVIVDYKANHRALVSSFFSYTVQKEIGTPPIVYFEHNFDWKDKLITMNDFQLNSDYWVLNLEEKFFDISRAVYYRLGYDHKTYSLVDGPLAAHWNLLKFGGVPTESSSGRRQRIGTEKGMSIFSGIGQVFTVPVHMNGFVRPKNNLHKFYAGMKEVGYSEDEIDIFSAVIQDYPVEKTSAGLLPSYGPPLPEADCDDAEFKDLVEACEDTGSALSDAMKSGFGDPIVSFQRIDMDEGSEYRKPLFSGSGISLEGSEAILATDLPTAMITGATALSAGATSFQSAVKRNKVSALSSQKPQLYENIRKGINVAESMSSLSKVNREISAISPEVADSFVTRSEMLPQGVNGLELRNPSPARSDTESLTDIVAQSTDDDECGANKWFSPCSSDLHILITEVFPGTMPTNELGLEQEPIDLSQPGVSVDYGEDFIAVEAVGIDALTGMAVSEAILADPSSHISLEHGTGENGLVEHDETSEDVDNTWEMLLACPGQGPGGCNDEPPYYPEPMPGPEPYPPEEPFVEYPEEEPISCGYVSKSVSTDRLNPEFVEGDFRVPFGYQIVKGPFSMACDGDDFDFSFTVPDQYADVKVLRCMGQMCMDIVLSDTPVEELYCDGVPMSQSIEDRIVTTRPALDPLMLDVFFDETKTLDENNAVSEQGYSVQFDSGGFNARVYTPDNYVSLPENSNYYIMGAPFSVSANVSEGVGATITMPLVPHEDYEGFGVFAFVSGAWRYLESRIDVNTGKAIASVEDIKALMSEGEVMFSVMGMYCHACRGTELNKVYDGGSQDIVVLVHGLTSTPSTWQFMIDDFSLTRQPYQVWVFGYPSSISLDDASIALARQLENISADRIYLVGHSLGGMVIQQALNFGSLNKYEFVKKTRKAILVATPNKGSPSAGIYDKLRDVLVNSKKVAGVYFINPLVVDDVLNGRVIARVPGIEYYVVAGTRPYPFSLGFFDSPNDGVVSIDSAQEVGGVLCSDMCNNYFEIELSHTDLISHPAARRVIEYIISMERAAEQPEEPLIGFNQYGHAWIDECSPSDRFVIVGRQVPEGETPGVLSCKCGNNQCDVGESLPSCPKDCAGSFGAWLCPWIPAAIPLLLFLALLLTAVYLVTKRVQKKDVSDVWRIMNYIIVVIAVILLLLGLTICKYLSLLAILIIIVIIILLLLDFFVPEKKEKKKLKEVERKGAHKK